MGIFERVAKSFGFGVPAAIDQAMTDQGMTGSTMMGPGRPVTPSTGYSQTPRAMDFPVGVNLAVRSRQAYGRTSYETLREMVNSYDVARMCINHKIDEIRSMGLLFQAATGNTTDVKDAIETARAVLAFPDREHPYDEWLSIWMENQLRYDAGVLYRRRNMAGEIIGLEIIDGSTIFPSIDAHGRRPHAPAPAYYQVIKGQSWSSYTAEDLIFARFRPQTDSPFGLAPLESIMLTANTDMRFQWHLLQMFTDGSVPAGFMELPPDISSPDQVAEWQDYYDAVVQGDQAKMHQLVAVPAGFKISGTRPKDFDPLFPDYLVTRVAAAYGVVPQDLGLLKDVNRANGETQVDIQFRVNTLPWVRFVEQILNRYLQHDLGLPVKVSLDTGRDKEDRLMEAQAWEVYVKTGAASMDEMRQELLGLPVDNERPIPRGIITARTGFVPLTSILAISGPIDGQTGSPSDDIPLALAPFAGAGGILADKLPGGTDFKRAPTNPDEPGFPDLEHLVPGSDVVNGMPTVGGAITKAETAGVTSATGLTGSSLEGPVKLKEATDALQAELVKFRSFTKTRVKAGKWRDFEFEVAPPDIAVLLNKKGRESVPFLVPAAIEKSWRDSADKVPQHAFDLRLTDHYTPLVAAAMRALLASVDVPGVVGSLSGALVKDAAADALFVRVRAMLGANADSTQLESVIRQLLADGYLTGAHGASQQLGAHSVSVAGVTGQAVADINWDAWVPGDARAASLVADGGLRALLDSAGVTVKGITDTALDLIGNQIGSGLDSGWSSEKIAGTISDLVGSDSRAQLIAHTEIARAQTLGSLDSYSASGVGSWDLILSDGACSECVDVAASNPHPVSDTESAPPVHPRCRCAASPVVESIDPANIRTIDAPE
jgi:phage portal protein BeeE